MILYFIHVVLFGFNLLHPLHISIANIDIDSKNSTIEMHITLDKEDLIHSLSHYYNIEEGILKDSIPIFDKYAKSYINSNLVIKTNTNPVKLHFESIDFNASNCLFSISGRISKKKIKSLYISNQLLIDTFLDQKNLIILNLYQKEYGYECNFREREIIINL